MERGSAQQNDSTDISESAEPFVCETSNDVKNDPKPLMGRIKDMTVSSIARSWKKYRNWWGNNQVFASLFTLFLAFVIVFLVCVVLTGGSAYNGLLSSDTSDIFMDHFNSVRRSAINPYAAYPYDVLYPPLIMLFYGTLYHYLIPYVDPALTGRPLSLALRNSQLGMTSYFLIIAFTFIVLHIIYRKILKRTDLVAELLFLFIALSYPLLFAVDRGNSIILAVVFSILFLMGYRSENKFIRYASYIALGIAAGIKLYPAILGLLILREKRYKEMAICVTVVFALIAAPFLITGGNVIVLFETIMRHVERVTPSSIQVIQNIRTMSFYLFRDHLGISTGTTETISLIILLVFTLLSFVVVIFAKNLKTWKIIALLSCNLAVGFGATATYMLIYIMIPVFFFLAAEKEMTKSNCFYLIFFVLVLAFFPAFSPTFTKYLIGSIKTIFVIIIAIAILFEGLRDIYRTWRDRKRESRLPSAA